MAEGADESQRTEHPTAKRLQEARDRGEIATSREFQSFLLLFVFALIVVWLLPHMMWQAKQLLTQYIEHPDSIPMDKEGLGNNLSHTLLGALIILLIPFSGSLIAALTGGFLQSRFLFTLEPIIPKLDRISPLAGLRKIFSIGSVIEMFKAMAKMAIIVFAAYYSIHPQLPHIRQLPDGDILAALVFLWKIVKNMLITICIIMFFIAAFDYAYRQYTYIKGLRMSKQEVKEEFKQQEGDPQIKGRIRQIRMEKARKRMIAAVPSADVIITNPTHYAIALQYDDKMMRAPKVVAKGLDNIAMKIREVAKEHDIPIIENPPLAQALYASVEIDREIKVEHYKAVAEIIGYVFRLKGRMPKRTT